MSSVALLGVIVLSALVISSVVINSGQVKQQELKAKVNSFDQQLEPAAGAPKPTDIPTHRPTDTQTMNNFQYPNSTKIGDNEYETSDSANTVTPWYKEKIANFNAKAFSQTNVNGKILNKLSGDNGKVNVTIEISQDPGGLTRIVVSSK